MTTTEWLAQAKEHRDVLISLLSRYHPRSARYDKTPMPITAARAEAVCAEFREEIRSEHHDLSPVEQFTRALEHGRVDTINDLLNEAWFGVPESSACWSIPGFREACDLIEDLPEDWDGDLPDLMDELPPAEASNV